MGVGKHRRLDRRLAALWYLRRDPGAAQSDRSPRRLDCVWCGRGGATMACTAEANRPTGMVDPGQQCRTYGRFHSGLRPGWPTIRLPAGVRNGWSLEWDPSLAGPPTPD